MTNTFREKAVKALAGLILGAAMAIFSQAQAQTIGPIVDGPFTISLLGTKVITYSGSFNAPAGPGMVQVTLSAPNILTTGSLVLNGTQIMQLSDFANGVTEVDKFVPLLSSNTFSFSVAGTRGQSATLTVYQVIMPTPSGLTPSPLALNAGAAGTLTATLSPTPTAAGTLAVTSSNTAVATVPGSIAFASGQSSVSIPVTAVAGGSATVTASANGGQASATVNVNAPPTVSLTSPTAGSVYSAPATITLSANAADADGTVAQVDFFDGATLVGTVTAAPYGVTLTNVTAGTHSYTARATDNLGATGTSAQVTVTVDAPPTVTITSPANGAVFAQGANITIAATATDSVGNVTKVDFYQGTTLLGTATASPYSFTWTAVPAGSYSLTAVATNDGGGTTTSAAVAIKVDAAPTVSLDQPANNAVFAEPATIALSATASDTVGNITKVDFYQGMTLIGTATVSPFTFSWTGVAAGAYSLTAVATNDAGMTATSSAVSVTVDAAPAVSISSPSNGSTFTAPATVNLAVAVSDAVGTVTQVDYYQGTTLIGSSTIAPFGFTWTSVPAGSYSLTAVATNDSGETATSGAVNITVNSAGASIYYIETDHLNTPRLIQDQAGNAVWRNDNTEPFGDSVPNGDPNNTGTTFEFNLRFPGQYFDNETGNFDNWFRTYSAMSGRYDQSDPIGLRGGLDPYAYVRGNPLSFVDPRGLFPFCMVTPAGEIICGGTPDTTGNTSSSGGSKGSTGNSDLDDLLNGSPAKGGSSSSSSWKSCPDCDEHFMRCLFTSLADLVGSVFGSSRCSLCKDACVRNDGIWPDIAMTTGKSVRCDYWNFK